MSNFPTPPPEFRYAMVGQKVVSIERDREGLGVQLTNGWNIGIWAEFQLRKASSGEPVSLESMEGAVLQHFVGDCDVEILSFDTDLELRIDLRSNQDSPAEAMILNGPNRLTVVWE
jgi:hypothetical protein